MCTGWKAEDVVRKHTNNIVILKDIMMHVWYEEELSFAEVKVVEYLFDYVMERITKREETTSIFYHRLKKWFLVEARDD